MSATDTDRVKAQVAPRMREWMEQEGHGVVSELERRWTEDRYRVVIEGCMRHGCLYFDPEGFPPVAVAMIPEWSNRVHPHYRERMFRDIWQQYDRYKLRELRGEPVHQPGDRDDFA